MNEADIRGAGLNNRDADRGVVANSVGDGMKARSFESAVDELCRMMLVPVATFAIVILRGWYQGRKRWPARIIEATLFAIVAKILMPAAQAFFVSVLKTPPQYAYDYAFMTCIIVGFVGVDTLSESARNYFGRE